MAGVAALTLVMSSGCQASTQVAVDEAANGTGVVRVTITLDPSALAAIGGQTALAAQLQDGDLIAAGWAITGPRAGPASATIVTATHAFATPAEASTLVEELAGSGAASQRPFRLALVQRRGFWHTDTTLTGTVDLTCGLACFGDSGLTHALGNPTGVNPAPLTSGGGQQPDQVFTFSIQTRLPGSLVRSDAAADHLGTLEWSPRLGQSLELTAVTRMWDRGRILAASIAAGVAVLVLLGLLGWTTIRWRSRRRLHRATVGDRMSGDRASGSPRHSRRRHSRGRHP